MYEKIKVTLQDYFSFENQIHHGYYWIYKYSDGFKINRVDHWNIDDLILYIKEKTENQVLNFNILEEILKEYFLFSNELFSSYYILVKSNDGFKLRKVNKNDINDIVKFISDNVLNFLIKG